MYTKDYFIDKFREYGLRETDTVFTHSSYKKIAGDVGVDGGADTIVDAFIEYFGEKGLVVFPAMSWKLGYLVNDKGEVRDPSLGSAEGFHEFGNHFDVKTTPSSGLGIIPEIFRKRPGVIRSLCPTSSVAAYGPEAEEFCAGHEKAETPLNWSSPWGKLYERKAKILFLGTTMICNTFMHAIEEHSGAVPGLLAPYIWKYTVTDYAGKTYPVEFKRHVPHHNAYYNKVEPELAERGIVKRVTFGSAQAHIADAVSEADYMVEKLKKTPLLFTKEYNEK